MDPVTTLKRTPFHAFHKAAGAKLVDFAGFEMPVRYTGDVREHQAVRERGGPVRHLAHGRVRRRGARARSTFLDRMRHERRVGDDASGRRMYTPMCRPDGGIVDDLLVYRSADHFMLVVNASNIAKDFAWLKSTARPASSLTDRSDATALLAVQGPARRRGAARPRARRGARARLLPLRRPGRCSACRR